MRLLFSLLLLGLFFLAVDKASEWLSKKIWRAIQNRRRS